MLKVEGIHVYYGNIHALKGVDLEVAAGEVHAIMGPNGSGKSTLANVLCGRDGYEVTKGSVSYDGQDLLDLDPEERAAKGVFLSFQYPVEIPGVSNTYVATGHGPWGILWAPMTGLAMSELLLDDESSSLNLRAFAPRRFDSLTYRTLMKQRGRNKSGKQVGEQW